MKPKLNVVDIPERDRCQTPPYALEPLVPYLDPAWVIWEPACGDRLLVTALAALGWEVIGSDILIDCDFFDYNLMPTSLNGAIVTNPPYSIKYKWLERCYELGKPFALLMPLETLGAAKAQKLFKEHGMELIVLNKRVNFKMPSKGWSGGGAQFPVAWFTYGLNIGRDITYGKINPVKIEE